jgi:hypothetical protein
VSEIVNVELFWFDNMTRKFPAVLLLPNARLRLTPYA